MASGRGHSALLLLPSTSSNRLYLNITTPLNFRTCRLPELSIDSKHIIHQHQLNINMANNSRYYYSLPVQAPQQPRSTSGSRRPPLTPSTVSSPCLTTQSTIASRRDSGSGSPTKAFALLAKVASHPSTPRGETPSSSPVPSPDDRMHSSPMYSQERPAVWRSESARYVHQYRQQGEPLQDITSS